MKSTILSKQLLARAIDVMKDVFKLFREVYTKTNHGFIWSRILTPFITDRQDPKWIKKGNTVWNIVYVSALCALCLEVLISERSIMASVYFCILILIVFCLAGILIQVVRPIWKKVRGKSIILKKGDNPFKDQSYLKAFSSVMEAEPDHSIDTIKAKAITDYIYFYRRDLLKEEVRNAEDLADWIRLTYDRKFKSQTYSGKTINKAKNYDKYVDYYKKLFEKVFPSKKKEND